MKDELNALGSLNRAMRITDPVEAEAHLEMLVENCMRKSPGITREHALALERQWLNHFASVFHDGETQARVARLFGTPTVSAWAVIRLQKKEAADGGGP